MGDRPPVSAPRPPVPHTPPSTNFWTRRDGNGARSELVALVSAARTPSGAPARGGVQVEWARQIGAATWGSRPLASVAGSSQRCPGHRRTCLGWLPRTAATGRKPENLL